MQPASNDAGESASSSNLLTLTDRSGTAVVFQVVTDRQSSRLVRLGTLDPAITAVCLYYDGRLVRRCYPDHRTDDIPSSLLENPSQLTLELERT